MFLTLLMMNIKLILKLLILKKKNLMLFKFLINLIKIILKKKLLEFNILKILHILFSYKLMKK